MKYEDKKTLVICFLMLGMLGFFSYQNIKNIHTPRDITPKTEIPPLDLPSIEKIIPTTIDDLENLMREHNIEGFGEPDEIIFTSYKINNLIYFKYPSHWKKLDIDIIEIGRDEAINILFMAHSVDIIHIASPTIIVFSEIKAEDINSSMEVIKSAFYQEGIKIDIIKKEERNDGLYFEIKYEYEDGRIGVSRERILIINGRFYLFSVIAFKERVENYSDQIDYIMESVQIIK